MKSWTKLTGLLLSTLMILTYQASIVLARPGGGKSGSLGGSLGKSFSSGSFSGGTGGSFGGFHSFFPFPFFFFGGSSFGGGSIFGLLFFLVVLYLVFKTMRSQQRWMRGRRNGRGFGIPYERPGKFDRVEDYSNNNPVDLNGRPISNAENIRRFQDAITFTRENMHNYSQILTRWDRHYLIGRIRQVFFWLQDGWSRQDLSEGSEYLSPGLLSKYQKDLDNMKLRGERNIIKEPVFEQEDIEFIHSHMDEKNEHFMVMISPNLIDYTVDHSGRLISGDDKHRLYFTEFWEFSWQGDRWVLNNIYQEDALEVTRIARGDEL